MVEIEIASLTDEPEKPKAVKTSKKKEVVDDPQEDVERVEKKSAKKLKDESNKSKADLEKKKNLQTALKTLSKSGNIKMGTTKHYQAIPSGVLIIDYLIGISNSDYKGYPRGRIIEVHGWEATGKTTLMTQACIEAQKLGMIPAYIDYEKAYDEKYAIAQGLDISEDKFIYMQPRVMEDLDGILVQLITSGCDFIVIDSVPAMTPKATLEKAEDEKLRLGEQARYMSEYIRKWNTLASENNCCLAFINQMRATIGQMKDSKATGGNALPFYASVRIELSPKGKETRMIENELSGEKESEKTGLFVKATIIKNKVGIPYKSGEFRVILGQGIDNMYTLRSLGEKKGVIVKSGAYYSYNSPNDPAIQVSGQGAYAFDKQFLDSPALFNDLRRAIGL